MSKVVGVNFSLYRSYIRHTKYFFSKRLMFFPDAEGSSIFLGFKPRVFLKRS